MTHPNIILVVSDQHRGDWLGAAGNRVVHTPNLDRMVGDTPLMMRANYAGPVNHLDRNRVGRTAGEADKAFMHEWGERVGLGRLDLWHETGPFFAAVEDRW